MATLGGLDEPFERMTPAEASALLQSLYAIEPTGLGLLDTERDDSFHVSTPGGDYVLKVAHPDDDPLLVNLQSAAMSFAAEREPSLPLQQLLLTVDGEFEPTVVVGGRERVARLLTWLGGSPLNEVRPDGDQLELLGSTLGALSVGLSTFDHPAAHREFVWDVAQLPLLRASLADWPIPEVANALDLFDRVVEPSLPNLPRQVIHNDFHLGNVLADPRSRAFVTGVIDFGDVVYSVRVADLAVALSYLIFPGEHTQQELSRFIEGFESRVPLTHGEQAVLPALVIARFAQRILVNLQLARGNPDDRGAAELAAQTNRAVLAALLEKEN